MSATTTTPAPKPDQGPASKPDQGPATKPSDQTDKGKSQPKPARFRNVARDEDGTVLHKYEIFYPLLPKPEQRKTVPAKTQDEAVDEFARRSGILAFGRADVTVTDLGECYEDELEAPMETVVLERGQGPIRIEQQEQKRD